MKNEKRKEKKIVKAEHYAMGYALTHGPHASPPIFVFVFVFFNTYFCLIN